MPQLEGPTTRIYNYVPGGFGEKKKKKISNRCQLRGQSLKKKKRQSQNSISGLSDSWAQTLSHSVNQDGDNISSIQFRVRTQYKLANHLSNVNNIPSQKESLVPFTAKGPEVKLLREKRQRLGVPWKSHSFSAFSESSSNSSSFSHEI